MACNLETVTYPGWWDGATTVRVYLDSTLDSSNYTFSREDIELLPEGVAAPSYLFPWAYVLKIVQVS